MNPLRWLGVALVIGALAFFFGSRIIGSDTEQELQTVPTSFTGVITDVESSGLNEVSSFDVRHDGITTTIYIREDFDYGFPIGHLQEHLSSGEPVIVQGEVIDGKPYADSIEDV